MKKITFREFETIMNKDLLINLPEDYDISKLASYQVGPCIEIEFSVDNNQEYQESWMGKLIDKETMKFAFWYGLTPDGEQAYDFDSFEEFVKAKVFHGKNIEEIWDLVSITSLDGGLLEEMLPFYLEDYDGEVARRI